MKRKLLSLFLAAVIMLSAAIMSIPASAELNFNDTDGHWATEAIEYVVENGLMNGVGNGESFAPNMSLTRGMVVTVLYRANGSPKLEFKGTFPDVEADKYYTSAAEWAYECGIVNGTSVNDWGEPTAFSPDRDITRQELATMFKRYADFKFVDTSKGSADISSYPDSASVAVWAADAVKWSVGTGLITGKSNGGSATLSPVDKASRAEFATIMKRFFEADFEYLLVYNDPEPISKFTEPIYELIEDADIYVAVDGDDSAPGTIDKPLATFEAAQLKVRDLKKTAKGEIVVAFKAGNYGKTTVKYTAEDSGTSEVPITYCRYGDGDVVFDNGINIDHTEFVPLDDSDKAYFTEDAIPYIFKADFSDKITTDLTVDINSEVFNDTYGRLASARYPDLVSNGNTRYSTHMKYTPESVQAVELFASFKTHFDSYHTYEGLKVAGRVSYEWLSEIFDVASYSPETGILTFVNKPYYGVLEGYKCELVVYNVSEELTTDGEYWLDRENSILYIYNPEPCTYSISTAGIFIDTTPEAVAGHTTFRGLNFRCTSSNGINIYGDYITVDDCDIFGVGGREAMNFNGNYYTTVKNCKVSYTAGTGIKMNSCGDIAMLKHCHNLIENNYVHHVGEVYRSYCGGIQCQGNAGLTVRHNEISNTTHWTLVAQGVDNIIEYNYVHDVLSDSGDMGVIYDGRSLIERGNIIRYNLICSVGENGSGSFAIYLDDGVSGYNIYGNIFYDFGTRGVLINGGRDNIIKDNIFILSGPSAYFQVPIITNTQKFRVMLLEDGVDYMMSSSYGSRLESLEYLPPEGTPERKLWMERWPELFNIHFDTTKLDDPYADFNPSFNVITGNYLFGDLSIDLPKETVEFGTVEDNHIFKLTDDGFFKNPAIGDYSAKDGSSLPDCKFEKIGRY